MKKWPRWKKIVGIVVFVLLVVVIASTVFIQKSRYPATVEAQKQSQVATSTKSYDLYTSGQKGATSIIFYPGAFVATASYSNWASQLAAAGINVYVLNVPLDLAVLAPDAANTILKAHPDEKFILAGHSLGGVMASRFAKEHASQVAGVIFLASYPDKKGSLKEETFPVLSITASNDGVLNWDKYDEAKQYLPKDTTYVEIKGGNHAGFGTYGDQKGDNTATISNAMQQTKISTYIMYYGMDCAVYSTKNFLICSIKKFF